jgi:PAS domain S-box-containing protein
MSKKPPQKELHQGFRELEKIFNFSLDMIGIGNLAGYFIKINSSFNRILGYTDEEFLAFPFLEFVHHEDVIETKEALASAARGEKEILIANRYKCKDGSYRWIDWKVFARVEENRFYAVGRDITDRKQLEENLEQLVRERTAELSLSNEKLKLEIAERKKSELNRQKMEAKALAHAKLASLGEIATGIAHEINQPLSYIKVIYQATLDDLEKGQLNQKELQEEFAEALRQVGRISRITDHLRTFGHSSSQGFTMVNIGSVLNDTLVLMTETIKLRNIALNQHITNDIKDIWGNAGQLEQVFINLFQNSLDALEGKENGIINISINNEKDQVVVYFSDNGPGIPREIINKVFEPFFTTKEVGKGTGLGLSIVYGIVEDHKGTISCKFKPYQGATFVIWFPQAEKP